MKSCPEELLKTVTLKILKKFPKKYLWGNLVLVDMHKKIQKFTKNNIQRQVSSRKISETFRAIISSNISGQLVLSFPTLHVFEKIDIILVKCPSNSIYDLEAQYSTLQIIFATVSSSLLFDTNSTVCYLHISVNLPMGWNFTLYSIYRCALTEVEIVCYVGTKSNSCMTQDGINSDILRQSLNCLDCDNIPERADVIRNKNVYIYYKEI